MSSLRAQDFPVPPEIDSLQRTAAIIGAIGIIASIVGAMTNHEQFYRSYLVAFLWVLGPTLGCLALLMVHHLSGGAWGLGVRRIFEASARTLPLVAILFVPIVLGMKDIFIWTVPEKVTDPRLQHLIAYKEPYLNVSFFVGRAVAYFVIWSALTFILTGWSRAQDTTPTPPPADRKFRTLSGPGLLIYGVTISFASFDWIMSLDPAWYSTVYGLLFMVGQGLTGISFTAIIAFIVSRRSPMDHVLTPEKIHDYGKLMLAFTMLWAYLSFSQFLIIWSANLPEEIPYYMTRLHTNWSTLSWIILFGVFVIPYVMLLSRDLKRSTARLAYLGVFVFVMRYVDIYWMVQPMLHREGPAVHWLDFTTAAGLMGLWIAAFCWNLKGTALVPVNDPYLEEALADGH
jgi:hypothetical protein